MQWEGDERAEWHRGAPVQSVYVNFAESFSPLRLLLL